MSQPVMMLYSKDTCDPVVLTQRLRVLDATRSNLRRAQLARDGVLRPTPLLDAAIECVEELLAEHLPTPKGGLL